MKERIKQLIIEGEGEFYIEITSYAGWTKIVKCINEIIKKDHWLEDYRTSVYPVYLPLTEGLTNSLVIPTDGACYIGISERRNFLVTSDEIIYGSDRFKADRTNIDSFSEYLEGIISRRNNTIGNIVDEILKIKQKENE